MTLRQNEGCPCPGGPEVLLTWVFVVVNVPENDSANGKHRPLVSVPPTATGWWWGGHFNMFPHTALHSDPPPPLTWLREINHWPPVAPIGPSRPLLALVSPQWPRSALLASIGPGRPYNSNLLNPHWTLTSADSVTLLYLIAAVSTRLSSNIWILLLLNFKTYLQGLFSHFCHR